MLENILRPCIIVLPGTCPEELSDLCKREEIAYLALQQFLSLEISWNDYLDCLEIAGANIDEFLVIADTNAFLVR